MGKEFFSWAFWLKSRTWQYISTYFDESVDKFRNQVISTYGGHVAWSLNSEEQGIRIIPYLSFLETNFSQRLFYPDSFFDIFVGYRLFPIAKYPLITYQI